jgi:hypothetical protein
MRQDVGADFAVHLRDVLSLHKPDGRVFTGIRALVTSTGILIMDASLPIEVGDRLRRILPSGVEENFTVDDPQFRAGMLGMPSHFQVKYHRLPPGHQPTPPKIPTFDEVAGERAPARPAEIGRQRRRGKSDPVVERIKKKVREFKASSEEFVGGFGIQRGGWLRNR